MSGYPQNRLIILWRIDAELLVCHLSPSGVSFPTAPAGQSCPPAADCHPLPVCRVRPVTGRASLSLRPCVVVILRHALASLRAPFKPPSRHSLAVEKLTAAYSTVGVDPLTGLQCRHTATGLRCLWPELCWMWKPATNCISAGWTAISAMPAGRLSVSRNSRSFVSCTSKNLSTGGTVSGLRRWMCGGTVCATSGEMTGGILPADVMPGRATARYFRAE